MQKLAAVFDIKAGGAPVPARKHELGFYFQGKWNTLTFKPQFTATNDPIERLDVTILQKQVLAPVFGVDDPRTSKRVNFVGGIRGTAELEKLVNSGEYACAFSMFPTSIEDLMSIADAGGLRWSHTEYRASPPELPPAVGCMQGAAGIAGWLLRLGRVRRDRAARRLAWPDMPRLAHGTTPVPR